MSEQRLCDWQRYGAVDDERVRIGVSQPVGGCPKQGRPEFRVVKPGLRGGGDKHGFDFVIQSGSA